MGMESPTNFTSPDGAVEKPKTLGAYYEKLDDLLQRQEKQDRESSQAGKPFNKPLFDRILTLRDEKSRLQHLVEDEGMSDKPIGEVRDMLTEALSEANKKYEKVANMKRNGEYVEPELQDEFELLPAHIDTLDKIISRMDLFEQGQL